MMEYSSHQNVQGVKHKMLRNEINFMLKPPKI